MRYRIFVFMSFPPPQDITVSMLCENALHTHFSSLWECTNLPTRQRLAAQAWVSIASKARSFNGTWYVVGESRRAETVCVYIFNNGARFACVIIVHPSSHDGDPDGDAAAQTHTHRRPRGDGMCFLMYVCVKCLSYAPRESIGLNKCIYKYAFLCMCVLSVYISDPPLREFILHLNEKRQFVIRDLDSTHIFVHSEHVDYIRTELERFRKNTSFETVVDGE